MYHDKRVITKKNISSLKSHSLIKRKVNNEKLSILLSGLPSFWRLLADSVVLIVRIIFYSLFNRISLIRGLREPYGLLKNLRLLTNSHRSDGGKDDGAVLISMCQVSLASPRGKMLPFGWKLLYWNIRPKYVISLPPWKICCIHTAKFHCDIRFKNVVSVAFTRKKRTYFKIFVYQIKDYF